MNTVYVSSREQKSHEGKLKIKGTVIIAFFADNKVLFGGSPI